MSPLKLTFVDTYFPRKEGPFAERRVARALVYQGGRFYIHLVKRDDAFGPALYPETPGGGVEDGETYEEAVTRECREELGLEVEVVAYLGEVDDEYALIGRKNRNRFFLCKALGPKHEKHLVSRGDSLISKTLSLTLDQAIELYESNPSTPICELVKRRELPFLRLLRDNPDLLEKLDR